MLRMFAKYQKPKEVTEPAKDTSQLALSQPSDPEEDYIVGQIAMVELELSSYLHKQRAEDEEEHLVKVSIADVQRACDVLRDGLGAKKLLEKKLAVLQAKLVTLNVNKQKSAQAQEPFTTQISELEAALELIDPASEAAELLRADIELLTQDLARLQIQSLDKAEDEIWQRLIILRKSLNKHRIEKYAAKLKQKFVDGLDAQVTDFQNESADEYELKEVVLLLRKYFTNPAEYVQQNMQALGLAIYSIIDEAKIKANAATVGIVSDILKNIEDDGVVEPDILECYLDTYLGRFFRKIDAEVEKNIDTTTDKLKDTLNREIAKVVLGSRLEKVQNLHDASLQRHGLLPISIQKDYIYHQLQFFSCSITLFRSLLAENLSRYDLIEEQIEEYQRLLEELYFSGTERSYKFLLVLQYDMEHENDDDVKELLELKHQLCHLAIVEQEQDLSLLYSSMRDKLNSSDETSELSIGLLSCKIAFRLYSSLLGEFISLLATIHQQIKDLQNTDLLENEKQLLNADLIKNQSQSILAAMKIHVAYCGLPNTLPTDQRHEVRFTLRLNQYNTEIEKYEAFHNRTYGDAANPCLEFIIEEDVLYAVSELMKSLPTAPIKSFVYIIQNYEFTPKKQVDDWSDFENNEETASFASRSPPPPPPESPQPRLARTPSF